jgi:hypothetical protein
MVVWRAAALNRVRHTPDFLMHGMRSVWKRCPEKAGLYPGFLSIYSSSAPIDSTFRGESRGTGSALYGIGWGLHPKLGRAPYRHMASDQTVFSRRGMQLSFPM